MHSTGITSPFDRPYLPLLAGIVVVVATGVVHGVLTDRWGTSDDLTQAASRVDDVPLDLADWHGTELDVDKETFQRADALTFWKRRYENRRLGASLTVVLMCGRPGRMAVHNPALVLADNEIQQSGSTVSYALVGPNGNRADLRIARYTKPEENAKSIRLFWTWKGASDMWEAPANARWHFSSQPYLYKLCVFHANKTGQAIEGDPVLKFVKQFLTQATRVLGLPDKDIRN